MKYLGALAQRAVIGHSPHGECGLKYLHQLDGRRMSARHSPHGECGLKLRGVFGKMRLPSHSPHGECGLK